MITDWVMRNSRCYEITGDQPCALVHKLIECVLTIGPGFAPNDWPRFIADTFAISIYKLAVAFHIALLEISSETMHILIVREYGFRCCSIEVSIPYPDKGHDDGNIFFKWRVTE